uniref:NADH-ubiquinone oxidoreductase chain 3 n=2 Tax=Agaricomycotina TaxID=5302 RepID=A0A2H4QBR3_9TREE|nr:NADH dehydrogenase subunit 3 [Auricularia auricula-judae]ATX62081.1 NADH dehydrogenase subunit 3 [Tremella fuciformis]QUX33080.1 NADH dehydrogenase subunit 3 [Auricularia auricula-judae]
MYSSTYTYPQLDFRSRWLEGFSGFSAIAGQTRAPFSIQYYLVGILFLIFDLEILLLYPIAVTLYNVSIYGFWVAMIFFTVLTLGFVYELGKGALYFTDQRSAINTATIVPERP